VSLDHPDDDSGPHPRAGVDARPAENDDARPFDLTGPLPSGVTVLEASAGTGKTYTIAALAARFVAEGTPLEQLLLVTFTRVATSELRERVRERLVSMEEGIARVLAGGSTAGLDEVTERLASCPPDELRRRLSRLRDAVANFDAATIETTHGFCQKVLDRLGTLAESEPEAEFVDNVDDLAREVIDDLYVRRFFRRPDRLDMSRDEAQRIAALATGNPLAAVHPLDPADGSSAAMRRRLALAVRGELEARKQALALMTHDDQLTRLLATLEGAGGAQAIATLRERYRVVLIDEFQDTDPIQWRIIDLAFGGGDTTLVLIGDPKQAIYAFRGADVYAYLEAARTAGTRATLTVNRRSDQALIDGLDALFGNSQLGHPGIVYRRVSAAPPNRATRLHGAPATGALRFRVIDRDEPRVERTPGGFPQADSTRAFVSRDLAGQVVDLLASEATIESRDEAGRTEGMTPVAPGDIAVLVRTHRQAAQIQRELEARTVPAVIGGSGSVFATEAGGDWAALLEAIEQPSQPARARAAAITPLIGWSAAQLAEASEPELELLHRQLHGHARLLREHGISSLSEAVLSTGQLAARLLTRQGGERRLTDLQHVAQLLGGAGDGSHLGVAALSAWLRQRIEAAEREGSNDERTRRLDSDADAVQIITIHRSKGLEFPIVFCPFLWEPGRLAAPGEPVYFHDSQGARAIDVGLEGAGYDAHLLSHNIEERGEELRLAYVALTRARHQAVLWWASAYPAKDSPLGRLLFARAADGAVSWSPSRRPREAEALVKLEEIAGSAPHAVAVERARLDVSAGWNPERAPAGALERARFQRPLDTSWRRTSYTALTAGAHEAMLSSEPEETVLSDEPSTVPDVVASELPLSTMASGPRLGTLIHHALQELEFDQPDPGAALAEWFTAAGAGRPQVLGAPAGEVGAGLALVLQTPLAGELGELSLSRVARRDRLDELDFELPLAGGDEPREAARMSSVGRLLERHIGADEPLAGYGRRLADPSLSANLRGYLTGSIDLVLRVRSGGGAPGHPARPDQPNQPARDRYAIIDYKTNWLARSGEPLAASHYAPPVLAQEMQRSHYVLQGLLYAVALHRYLRWRLADYEPETDLAGIHYLFVRGMVGPELPGNGVFHWHPPAELIVALSDLLAEGGEH
jgi:exodeoxyribonuclease V beta subunit